MTGDIKESGKHLPPLLLYLAGKDEEICNDSAKRVYSHLPIEDKEMHIDENAQHNMLSDGLGLPKLIEMLNFYFKK